MNSGIYSDWKPAWHISRLQDLRCGKQIVPAQIQLIISDLCNQDCSFCAYRMSGYTSNKNFGEVTESGVNNNPNRMIPTPKALEIVEDAAKMGVGGIQFTGGGEPTVHPDHLKIISSVLDLQMEAALVTNGAVLRNGWRDVFPRLSWLRVSLDAGTDTTYSRIRKVPESTFGKVLRNLEEIADVTRDSNCCLGVSFIVTKDNYREIPPAARIASEIGVPSIRYAAMFSPELGDYYTSYQREEVSRQIDYARRAYSNSGFAVLDMFTERLSDLDQGKPDYGFCGYQQFNVYIGGDLNVYRCCNTAYNDLGLVGSLKNQSLAEFWASEEKKNAYGGFDARSCQHCAFNEKNRLINKLVTEKPKHLSFV